MVNDQRIKLTPAYQLAALKPEEQALLVETIESEQATPSVSQAQRMKKMSQEGKLNEDTMLSVMSEQKKPEVDRIVLPVFAELCKTIISERLLKKTAASRDVSLRPNAKATVLERLMAFFLFAAGCSSPPLLYKSSKKYLPLMRISIPNNRKDCGM